MKPLNGVRVLDLSRLLPGPYCTLFLADLGAEVIKIEDTGEGDYLRGLPPLVNGENPLFAAINRDKRSLALDLKSQAGKEIFFRLLAQADVVVESFRPGVIDRLGIGYSEMRRRRREIVLLSISGYGQSGAESARAGHDLNFMALAGILAENCAEGEPPVVPPVQFADVCGGALWGVVAVLAAILEQRATGGDGQWIDLSMEKGATSLAPYLFAMRGIAEEGSRDLIGGYPAYGIYETRDGRHVSLAALEEKFWRRFCEVVKHPEWQDLPKANGGRREEIRARLKELFLEKTLLEWREIFSKEECCVEPLLFPEEVGAKADQILRVPFSEGEAPRLPAPLHGEHTREIVSVLGFSASEVMDFFENRVVLENRRN